MNHLSRTILASATALGMAVAVPALALAADSSSGSAAQSTTAEKGAATEPANSMTESKAEKPMMESKSAKPMMETKSAKPMMETKSTKPMDHHTRKATGDLEHWTAWDSRVRDVQEALNKEANDKLVVDGILGSKTRAAIKAFQTKHGLKVTGEPDKATLDMMHVVPRSA